MLLFLLWPVAVHTLCSLQSPPLGALGAQGAVGLGHDGHAEALPVGQDARQWLFGATQPVLLRLLKGIEEPDALGLSGGQHQILHTRVRTFLKSAICVAYWEGVRLRLGG